MFLVLIAGDLGAAGMLMSIASSSLFNIDFLAPSRPNTALDGGLTTESETFCYYIIEQSF